MTGFIETAEGKCILNMFKAILRIFGYLYHIFLGLFLLIVSGLSLISSGLTLRMEMLPWDDPTLSYVVFFSTLVGLISLVLSVKGKCLFLFRLWAIAVLALMVVSKSNLGISSSICSEFMLPIMDFNTSGVKVLSKPSKDSKSGTRMVIAKSGLI